ncbi:MAG: hypothetical protein U9N14_05395, partial [Pseudomonadota bacterium]|nr:hypothetical protein [Pseudomonadota bacterium]
QPVNARKAARLRESNLVESRFAGIDGLFRFGEDGRVERGLAILEIRKSGAKAIDSAPRSFNTARY